MSNSVISEEMLAHIKFQIKQDIIDALKKDLNDLKMQVNALEERCENSLNSIPQIINDNISVILEDYNYFKNRNCFCFRRK